MVRACRYKTTFYGRVWIWRRSCHRVDNVAVCSNPVVVLRASIWRKSADAAVSSSVARRCVWRKDERLLNRFLRVAVCSPRARVNALVSCASAAAEPTHVVLSIKWPDSERRRTLIRLLFDEERNKIPRDKTCRNCRNQPIDPRRKNHLSELIPSLLRVMPSSCMTICKPWKGTARVPSFVVEKFHSNVD